jgi:acyl-CoA synthetase (AMP-forming)/AMP-acid ligase II
MIVAQWWLPDRVIFIDEIPKTGTGKFHKKAIRDENPDLPIAGSGRQRLAPSTPCFGQ